jgi:putative redox protein
MEFNLAVSFPGEGYAVDVQVGEHLVRSDMVPDGVGPSPGELFLSGLAACVGAVARGYCISHQYPQPEAVSVHAEYDLETELVNGLEIKLQMPADFPEKHEEALKRAVDTCSVKKAWLNPPAFVTTVEYR